MSEPIIDPNAAEVIAEALYDDWSVDAVLAALSARGLSVVALEPIADEPLNRMVTKRPTGHYANCAGCEIEWLDDDDSGFRVIPVGEKPDA